jgi:hypothetical protein
MIGQKLVECREETTVARAKLHFPQFPHRRGRKTSGKR